MKTMRPRRMSSLLFFALAQCFLACIWLMSAGCSQESDATDGKTTSQNISVQGGILTIDGGLLSIPPNALLKAQDITFAATELGAPEVLNRTRVTESFRIEPLDVRFVESAEICIAYDTRRLPMDVTASLFDLRRMDATGAQERLTGVKIDLERGYVCGEVLRGGVFWATVPNSLRPTAIHLKTTVSVLSVGDTAQISATVTDQTGAAMSPEVSGLTFSTSEAAVLSIDGDGLVTALRPGRATVTATAGAARANLQLSVRDSSNHQLHFQWFNPLPQGNSLTALSQDPKGRLAFATTDGSLWREEKKGENQFKQLHKIPGVRFAEIAFRSGEIVAAGALGQSGIVLNLTEQPDKSFTPKTISVSGAPMTKIHLSGDQGIATGPGQKALIFDNISQTWNPTESPTFHSLAAGTVFQGIYRALTSVGTIYDYNVRENTWTKINFPDGPNEILDAVPEENGFAVLASNGAFYRINFSKGWSFITHLLPHFPSETLPDTPLEEGQNSEDGGNFNEDKADNDSGDFLKSDLESNNSLDAEETPSDSAPSLDANREELLTTITAVQGIFALQDGHVLIRVETLEGPQILLEKLSDNSSYLFESLSLPSPTTGLFFGPSSNQIFSGGKGGELYVWDGKKWLELSSGVRDWIIDIKAFEDGTVLALTERCDDANCHMASNALLKKSPGPSAFIDATPLNGFSGRMHAVEGHSSSDYWVMGEGGLAFHWSDGAWSSSETGTLGSVYGLKKCGNSIFSAGENGTIGKEIGGYWTELARMGGSILRDIACSPKDVQATFAVGDYQILIWNNGEFTSITPNDNAIRTAYWKTVYTTDTGEAFIGGNARYILFWNGVQFEFFDYPAKIPVYSVKKIHGTSLSDVWAAGTLTTGEGFLIHFDGAEWTKIDLPSVRPILALDKVDDALWIGGGNGTLNQGTTPPNSM